MKDLQAPFTLDTPDLSSDLLQTLLKQIKVEVRVDQETLPLHRVEATQGVATETCDNTGTLTFGDAGGTVTVGLTLQSRQGIISASVAAETINPRVIGRYRRFDAIDGIVVYFGGLTLTEGYVASYQHKDWWTRPFFGSDVAALPPKTQSLLWKQNGHVVHMLPVCDSVIRTELRGSEKGLAVALSAYDGGHDRYQALAFVLAAGNDPFELMKSTIRAAREQLSFPVALREDRIYPEILDFLGWCSWDAFYHQVHHDGIIAKAAEFAESGLPVKWFMIDDGWLDVRRQRLHAFEADQQKFPGGLAATTKALKTDYGVRWVGVWHTLFGYWDGIDETSDLARTMSHSLFPNYRGQLLPYPDASRGFGFWNAWHAQLKKSGIDFVKVDGQSAVRNYVEHHKSIGEAATEIHTALEASTGLHFGQTVINCMGMAAENIWHRPNSGVSRSSDDFTPTESFSFREHAVQNAYNNFYHGAFYWGDWDMFWTQHPQAENNAVLRAVSGGPVYISDPTDKTDSSMVWPLILKDGRVLRCEQPGQPTLDCLFVDPLTNQVPLKVWNRSNGIGVVAAFHVHSKGLPVTGEISPRDVPGLGGDRFALYNFYTGALEIMAKNETRPLTLRDNEVALYLVIPYSGYQPLGLLNKFISPATMKRTYTLPSREITELYEGGPFGFLSEQKPRRVLVNGRESDIIELDHQGLYVAHCASETGPVLVEVVFD